MSRFVPRHLAYAVGITALAAGVRVEASPPLKRPEMKRLLELQKKAAPHLPMPPDSVAGNNNSRFREFYVPNDWYYAYSGNSFGQVDGVNQVRMFWIVSRSNDCRYCMGHQEGKLRRLEQDDLQIGALDGDWSGFDPKAQACLALARKLTLKPHEFTDADLASLRPHFDDPSIVAAVYFVARFNSTNRWTGSLNLPQDSRRSSTTGSASTYETPTAPSLLDQVSWIGAMVSPTRPALESWDEMTSQLKKAEQRKARVALASTEETAKVLASEQKDHAGRSWLRALAVMDDAAPKLLAAYTAQQTTGKLPALLKAKLAWTAARHNRAWYSLAEAKRRLEALGLSGKALAAWDASMDSLPEAERAALELVRKITVTPANITADDFVAPRKHFSDHEVGEIVFIGCFSNQFDRFTEALGLPIERQ